MLHFSLAFLSFLVGWVLGLGDLTSGWLLAGTLAVVGVLMLIVPRWRGGTVLCLTCVAFVVGGMVGEGLVYHYLELQTHWLSPGTVQLVWKVPWLLIVVAALTIAGIRLRQLRTLHFGRFRGRWVLLGVAFTVLFGLWYHFRYWPVLGTWSPEWFLPRETGVRPLVTAIVTFGVLQALLEELLYRGFLLSVLRRHVSWTWAVGLQALIYGMAYLRPDTLPYGISGAVVMGLFGLYFGFGTAITGGLFWPVVIHMGINLAVFFIT